MPIKIKAFTLSEILITLAIIGVVAALTIPNLVYSYKKRVVKTRLLKFYNIMNETIRLSEIDNGDKKTWSFPTNQFADNKEKFYNKYLYTNKLYATKIIQMNNWKIPDDYPWKL